MSNTRTTLTIPRERHLQLQEVAEAFGTSNISETIGQMLHHLARLGVVTTTLPGIEINRLSDGLVIIVEGGKPLGLNPTQAATLAENLRRYVSADTRLGTLVNLDDDYAIARKGNGMKLCIPFESGEWKTLAYDLALELADKIDAAISSPSA